MPTWLSWASALASAASLGLTVWLLVVAEGAKRAAERAEGAIRKQNLREDVESVREKIHEVGIFLDAGDLALAGLRAREVMGIGTAALGRWRDDLSVEDREDLLAAVSLLRSVVEVLSEAGSQPVATARAKRLSEAQLRAEERVSGLVGRVRRLADRGGK